MRVKFRIGVYKGGVKLKRKDFLGKRDPLSIALRYVAEFKYLEATKWLFLAEDSFEKYYLLGLINETLGQEEEAEEFYLQASRYPRKTELEFKREAPHPLVRNTP